MRSAEGNPKAKVVAVTGARGIGLAAAHRFGKTARVVIADVSDEQLDSALASLRKEGIDATGVLCDVSSPGDVKRFAEVAKQAGTVSVVFHASGLSPSMASAERILRVNYLGTQVVIAEFGPLLGSGSVIVCFSSPAACRRKPGEYLHLLNDPREKHVLQALLQVTQGVPAAAYALSKMGVRQLVERHATELGHRGIRIFSISPGAVDTAMGRLEVSRRAMGPVTDGFLDFVPLGRWASPEEIAAFAQLLCEPAAAYFTGCDVMIDGGAMAYMKHAAPADTLERFDDPWKA